MNWSCDLRANEKLWRKRMTELINELMNYEGVYRTPPATPGLLKTGRGKKCKKIVLKTDGVRNYTEKGQEWCSLCTILNYGDK